MCSEEIISILRGIPERLRPSSRPMPESPWRGTWHG